MKKTFKNLILIFSILILNCQNAFCYVLTSDNLNTVLTNKLKNEAIKKLNLKQNSEEITIKISNIPFKSLTIQTSTPKIEILDINTIQPNTFRRITLKNPDNSIIKSFNVNVETTVMKEVLVASENILFNSEITPKNSKLEKVNILKYRNRILTDYKENLIAKRNYQKGSVIFENYARSKSEITKNTNVDIVFLSKGLKIKLQGKALKDGNIGDEILVRSDKYNKTYTGTINSSNEVVVRI